MKTFVAIVLLLDLCAAIVAQQGEGGGGGCYVCVVVTDNSCDGTGTACSGELFTASCDATVTLYCDLISCIGDCADCRVNAKLSRVGSGVIAECSTNNEEDCTPEPDFDCDQTGSAASLQQGTDYKLDVCLMPCFYHSCPDCIGCVARGWVRTASVPYTCP